MDNTNKIPNCVGIILDGNRTWARNKGLPTLEGHRVGLTAVKDAVKYIRDAGVKHLALYMFSTENWSRTKEEVSYLMDLFLSVAKKEMMELSKEGVKIRFSGQRERFSNEHQKAMKELEEISKENNQITLWACMSYGGRAEILEAVKKINKEGLEVNEETINSHLWTAGMPDPDIIIRTSGQVRLSGFLTWQSVYSELFFIDTLWPDFSKEVFESILEEYSNRNRKMGK